MNIFFLSVSFTKQCLFCRFQNTWLSSTLWPTRESLTALMGFHLQQREKSQCNLCGCTIPSLTIAKLHFSSIALQQVSDCCLQKKRTKIWKMRWTRMRKFCHVTFATIEQIVDLSSFTCWPPSWWVGLQWRESLPGLASSPLSSLYSQSSHTLT